MVLGEEAYKKILDELDHCKNPLFLFHDDADGLSSFLLLYRYKKEGHGFAIKSTPRIDEKYLKVVENHNPDKIFVLDIAIVEESFSEEVKVPIIWIDHHEPREVRNTKYFNPRTINKDQNFPASYLCYNVVKQDLWIAMAGIVGDWVYVPELYKEYSEKYPKLLSPDIDKPDVALFESMVGKIAKVFNFILKGDTKSAFSCIKVMTRIKDPMEIFEQTTSQGRFIWKKYDKMNKLYKEMYEDATQDIDDSKVLLYKYQDNKTSFTGDLANELLYKYPEKIIVIARMKSGEAKCSLRSGKDVLLPPIVEKSLVGVQGYGGGHEHACGCCIQEDQFDQFIENLKSNL